ncbi:MAG: hypothetical protein ACRELT_02335 [Longimicrobiales bacterium]
MLNVTVGRAQAHENLTIFPLLAVGAGDLPYTLLVDALSAGTLSIGGDCLVHLSAFPASAVRSRGTNTAAQENPVAPPSRRRHHRGGGTA